MAKFSDSLRDTVGSVLEGYISAYGGDPTVTPTYQDRKRREELALEQEKARAKSVQDAADRAAELEMYEAKKRIDQSFEDPDGVSEEQQRVQNVIGGLRQSMQGSDALAIKPQRFALGETVNKAVQELTANVGERASQIDLSMYREEVRPKVASLIRASTDVRTSGVMNEEAKEGAYIDIANELAKYDEDMIPQMTPQEMSDKHDEIFRINMTPLIGGAYGYTDKNTGAMKILHNNSEVAEYEANLARRARKEEFKIQDAQQMREAIRAIPDSEIVASIESEFGKGALDDASPEERTEAINLGRQKRAIEMMEQREDLFNLPDTVAYERLDDSERKKYEDLAKSSFGYPIGDGQIQGINAEDLDKIFARAYEIFVNEQDAKRKRLGIEKIKLQDRANESLMRRAASNPALRRVLLGKIPSDVLAAAAVQGTDPLQYLMETGQTDLIRGAARPQAAPPSAPSAPASTAQSALRKQAEKAADDATEEAEQEAVAEVTEKAEVPELYSPELQDMSNRAYEMFSARSVPVGGEDIFRDDRASAYSMLTESGMSYDQADAVVRNVNPLLLANNMQSMSEVEAVRKTIMDTAKAYAEGKAGSHISGQSKKDIEAHMRDGTPVLSGTDEEQAAQLKELEAQNPSAVFITADGYIGQLGTEGVVGKTTGSVADAIDRELEGLGRVFAGIPESELGQSVGEVGQAVGEYSSWYTENVGMPLVELFKDAARKVRRRTSQDLEGMGPTNEFFSLPSNTEELLALLNFVNEAGKTLLPADEYKARRKKAYDRYLGLKEKRVNKDSYNKRMYDLVERFKEKKQELDALKKKPSTFENTQKRLAVVSEIKVIQDLARYIKGEPGSDFDPNKPRPTRLPEVPSAPIEAPSDFRPLFGRSGENRPQRLPAAQPAPANPARDAQIANMLSPRPSRLPEVGSRSMSPEREAMIDRLLDRAIPRPTRLPAVSQDRPKRLPRAESRPANPERDAQIEAILSELYPRESGSGEVSEKYKKTKKLLDEFKAGDRSLEKLKQLLDSVE